MFRKYKYHVSLLAAALGYAGISVFATLLTRQNIDAFSQIQGRAFFGALTTFIILKFSINNSLALTKKEFIYLVFSSFLLVGAYTTAILSIFLGTPIAKADALIFTYPITVVAFSYIFLKDIPSLKQIIAIILSLTSAMILLEIWKTGSIGTIRTGEIMALICSVFYSVIIVFGRIISVKTKLPPLKITFYSLFLLIPQLWILGLILDRFFNIQILQPHLTLSLPWVSWLTLLAFGLISTTLPNNLFYIGMSRVKPNVASLLLVTELAWVSILGIVLFGQTLSIIAIIGIIGICAAVLLI